MDSPLSPFSFFLLNALVMNQQRGRFMSVSPLTTAVVTFPCQQQIVAVNLFVGSFSFWPKQKPEFFPLDPSSNTADLFSITQLEERLFLSLSLKGDIHIFAVFYEFSICDCSSPRGGEMDNTAADGNFPTKDASTATVLRLLSLTNKRNGMEWSSNISTRDRSTAVLLCLSYGAGQIGKLLWT